MADVRPFPGIRYGPAAGSEIGRLLCPPYDQITPAEQDRLYGASPMNVVRLEFARPRPGDDVSDNPYARAAATLGEWLANGVLVKETQPAFYLVVEEYPLEGARQRRVGLFARVRLEEYERGVVLPHEHTRKGPKEDRLRLMETCGANFSPVMALYRDPGSLRPLLLEQMAAGPPSYRATCEDGRSYRAWVLADPALHETVHGLLEQVPLYLADGHHRYETSLAYRDRQRGREAAPGGTAARDYVMMCLIDLLDEGLRLQSFHRVVSGLAPRDLQDLMGRVQRLFHVEPRGVADLSEEALASCLDEVVSRGTGSPAFGLLDPAAGRFSVLTLREEVGLSGLPEAAVPELRRCETWVLHQGVLDPVLEGDGGGRGQVEFVHELSEVARQAARGARQAVFLVPPMDMDLFEALVRQGQRLPPKSTYFDPKLPTGLVMNPLV